MGAERPEPTLPAEILKLLNRRIPNGTYGGVRGRSLKAPPTRLSCSKDMKSIVFVKMISGKFNRVNLIHVKQVLLLSQDEPRFHSYL